MSASTIPRKTYGVMPPIGGGEAGQYLTPPQAAEYLSLSENALAKMRLTGDGPPYAKFGRRVRYGQVALDAWASARTYASTASTPRSVGTTHDR
jgi:hypothetical protein